MKRDRMTAYRHLAVVCLAGVALAACGGSGDKIEAPDNPYAVTEAELASRIASARQMCNQYLDGGGLAWLFDTRRERHAEYQGCLRLVDREAGAMTVVP